MRGKTRRNRAQHLEQQVDWLQSELEYVRAGHNPCAPSSASQSKSYEASSSESDEEGDDDDFNPSVQCRVIEFVLGDMF